MVVKNKLPFDEKILNTNSNYIESIRSFSYQTDNSEFVWHMDKEDREIEILESYNWFFQIENELPVLLKNNDIIFIKKNTWHRIINKSDKNLIIKVKKHINI
jgi:hypothetical protein